MLDAIREALPVFGRQMPGYDHPDVVMTGVEMRDFQPGADHARGGLCFAEYTRPLPAGEGAGYGGGTLSAAVDGIKVAEAVALDLIGAWSDFDAIILGAGAAGLFCAAVAGQRGRRAAARSQRRAGPQDPDLRGRALQFHQSQYRAGPTF